MGRWFRHHGWRMMRAALALALASMWLGAGPAPTGWAQAEPKVGPGVLEAVRAGGARVVVALAEPTVLSTAATDLPRVRAGVAAVQAAVLAAVKPGSFALGPRFQAVPALAGTILTEAGLNQLAAQPSVRRIDLDVGGTGQLNVSVPLIGADQWHAQGNTAENVVVAVLDTGVYTDNTDLSDDLIFEACFLDSDGSINGVGLCPNGSDRQLGPGAAVAGPTAGHGTHVSGIITSGGVNAPVGVAPGADLVAVKVLDNTGFAGIFYAFSEIVAALDYILNSRPDVQVINMSLGTTMLFAGDCDNATAWTMAGAAVINALRANGVIAFAVAGNSSSGTQMSAPGCLSNVIAVGATDDFDHVASFSNSNASTDLMAPGVDIISAAGSHGTIFASGTSMASPHAAGCAALLIASGVATTPDAIETWLESSPITVLDSKNGLSFPRLDCRPPSNGPERVTVAAQLVAFSGVPALFSALVEPLTTSLPLTYTWDATAQALVVHANVFSTTDTISFTWALTGTQAITLTAANSAGVVTDLVTVSVEVNAPQTVTIGAPVYVRQTVPATFGALVEPLTTSLPLTYTWLATGQAPVVHTHVFSITDAISFTWALTGTQTITVTAANGVGVVTDTVVVAVELNPPQTVTIWAPFQVHQAVPATFSAVVRPQTTTPPLTYTWQATGQAPVVHANVFSFTDAISFTWLLTGTQTITLTATNGVGVVTDTVVVAVEMNAPQTVTIGAPLHVHQAVPATFTAAVQPLATTLPLTYTWRATGQVPVLHAHVYSVTDAVNFTWTLTGTQTITVTAANAVGVVTHQTMIAVTGLIPVYLPIVCVFN